MKLAELLHDSDALARGDELIALYQDALRTRDEIGARDRHAIQELGSQLTVDQAFESVMSSEDLSDEELALFGRNIIAAQQRQERIEAIQNDPNRYFSIMLGSVKDFLRAHAHRPIAAETVGWTGPFDHPIIAKKLLHRNPNRVSGFLLPVFMYRDTGEIHVSKRPNPKNKNSAYAAAHRVRLTSLVADYPPRVRIAIGE